MKAIVYRKYGTPDVLSLEEVSKPTPKSGEVLIRVEAVMASPSDCAMRSGDPFAARIVTGFLGPKKPILGTELAGTVEAVGEGVKSFAVGDEIWAATGTAFGGYAEYIALPADGALAKRPASLSLHALPAADPDPLAVGERQRGLWLQTPGRSGKPGLPGQPVS